MIMSRVGKLEIMTKFDADAQGRLLFDGKIFTNVSIAEIDRGYRITITDAEHPNGVSYDVVDNGMIVVTSAADIEALSDVNECLILVRQNIEYDGVTFYTGLLHKSGQNVAQISRFITTEDIENWNNSFLELENEITALSTPDTLVPLSLGVTYDELIVRPDWQDVPVYIIGDNPVVCRLASDNSIGGFAESEIRLMYLVDYITGMPCPALAVTSAGNYLTYFPVTYHAMGKTLTAGWYDASDNAVSGTPTFTNMTFDRLIIGSDDPIRSLDNLSAEERCALEMLSRMVNVSVEAMGGLGVVQDGVQRLTNAPQVGRRYSAVTSRNITFPLPEIAWSGTERDFWVDLDCTSSIDLTFADTVCYEDGGNVDTTRGKHRLHFYAPAGASVWTVAETESVVEVTEDVVPEYAIPFRNIAADQLRAVLKYGYQNGNGVWCARKYGMEIEFFHVGDKRPVTLIDGREVMMRIIGIDHDDLPNGGKAALTCDFIGLVSVEAFTVYNAEYLNNSLRAVTKSVKDVFPDWLRELLTPVVKVYNENGFDVTDDVWAFSSGETGKSGGVGTAYPIFTDNASRARKNESDNYTRWILRTMASGYYPTETISDIGVFGGAREPEVSDIAVGFCLNV